MYFNGTFEDPGDYTFDAQMQLSIDINMEAKTVYLNIINYNTSYEQNYWFEFTDGIHDVAQ
jgi:hypothetical protein